MKKTILVVDDEPILREILRESFELEDYQVLEAENGTQAIDLVKTQAIDCIISDIRMPGGSGVDLAKALHVLKQPKPSLILMTGFSDFTWEQAQKLDVIKMLSKPFEPDAIVKEVRRVLTGTR